MLPSAPILRRLATTPSLLPPAPHLEFSLAVHLSSRSCPCTSLCSVLRSSSLTESFLHGDPMPSPQNPRPPYPSLPYLGRCPNQPLPFLPPENRRSRFSPQGKAGRPYPSDLMWQSLAVVAWFHPHGEDGCFFFPQCTHSPLRGGWLGRL